MAISSWLWWVGAGVLVLFELLSGTFYLLMIALGFIAAGLVRAFGIGIDAQMVVAAIVALAAVLLLRRSRLGRKPRQEALHNPDVNLDIGQNLTVDHWLDRRARVNYRGAAWDVQLAPGEPEDARNYTITALDGSCLVVVAHRQAVSA
ncbi:NfeD family protein [Paraburkholderia sp.]|uniref:NfeD family protein n=1 Tax=Paraburkholderia sp. TaxID=1926495 RepID=UPI00238F3932|nr:NfeD family protein [Paraburkholderia sp.]MDE1184076.1 NfeD family protein [Paraburkholderia sp.]